MIRIVLVLLAAASMASPVAAQQGDAWPSRPIRLIAPFPPASTVDVVSRIVGQQLSQRLGQQIIVDNRAGASGNIGADAIAKAAPDGYTIGVVTNSTHAVAVTLTPNLPYDPAQGFHADHDDREHALCAGGLSRAARPKAFRNSSRSPRASPAFSTTARPDRRASRISSGALFATLSDIQMTHVPYKSSAQSVVDIISGRLDMQFATIAPTLANIRAGQLRALATTGLVRADTLPDIPTMDEAGVKGYEATLWFALMAPPGLPAAIAARLNKEADRGAQESRGEGRRSPNRASWRIRERRTRSMRKFAATSRSGGTSSARPASSRSSGHPTARSLAARSAPSAHRFAQDRLRARRSRTASAARRSLRSRRLLGAAAVARRQQYRNLREAVAHRMREVKTVQDAGHQDVGKHEIDRRPRSRAFRAPPARSQHV